MTTPHDTHMSGHGPAEPCPFCGQPVSPGLSRCEQCMLPLDERTLGSLVRLMGPWFVLESKTPSAPGVAWAKFCDLIAKGRIRPDSVVRGPSTGGLWKLAQDTPSVATRLGLCWSCHSPQPPDRSHSECSECGAALNGAVDWPGSATAVEAASVPASTPEPGEPDPLDDLIQAGASEGANGFTPYVAPRRSGMLAGLIGLIIAGVLGAGASWAMLKYTRGRHQQPSQPDTATMDDPRLAPSDPARAPRLPRDGSPGEMYPNVPEYVPPASRPAAEPYWLKTQRRDARRMYNQALEAERSGELMKAQELLVKILNDLDSRAHPPGALESLKAVQTRILAAAPPPDQPDAGTLARQKRTAAILMETAQGLLGDGDPPAAQLMLMKIVNAHHRAAWPAGTEKLLRDVQAKIVADKRPKDEPTAEDLRRQQAAAEKLFDRAKAQLSAGNYVEAQKLLLKILNAHHPKAWPDGALAEFQRTEQALGKGAATRPRFFGIEARP